MAFTLLVILGGRMIMQGISSAHNEDDEPVRRHTLFALVCTAIATSLDAMAIGVGLVFLQVNIFHTAMVIGCATMIMVTLGMMIGRYIGPLMGKKLKSLAVWC